MSQVRTALVATVLGGALVISATAYAMFAGGGPSPDPFVAGGGGFTGTIGAASFRRDFGLDAHVEKKGSNVYGILRYGRNLNAIESSVQRNVTCVSISASEAVVGGRIVGTDPPAGWVMAVKDTGTPGGPTDQVSFVFEEPLTFTGWPVGFPDVCPSPADVTAAYGLVYNDLDAGDVVVSAGSG